ncbi:MAG: hypothetical protein ACYC4H_00815 [Desulfocucumaceae bacterium]
MLDVLTWADDLYPLVFKRFQDRYEKRTDLIKLIIGKETIKTLAMYDEGIGGYGYVPDYNGTTIPELNQKRGFKSTYTPKEKAAKATVMYKYAKVDQSGEAKKAGSKMADSLAMTQVRDFYNLFANGWNTGYLGSDGKPLFSATHPINSDAGADTFSNTGTSLFSISAITAAQTAAQRFLTFDGLPFDCDYDLCLISPELEPKAKEFFGKEAKLIPESAENGANPVYGMKYFVIKGFTAKQWAVADSMLLKEYAKIVEITAPMVIPNKPDNPLIQEYVGYMDYVLGWSDSRMIYGHSPA